MSVDGLGFHVEPDVLVSAANAMNDIVRDQDASPLRILPSAPEHYGGLDAHAAMVAFCDAWEVGTDALCDRSRRMAGSMRDAAQAYSDADLVVGASMDVDPGSGAVNDSGPTPPPR